MKQLPNITYKDGETTSIYGYSISDCLVSISYHSPVENNSGFILSDNNGTPLFDGSDYIYRWDVLNNNRPNEIWYTNNPMYKQSEPFLSQEELSGIPIPADPLNNEELTEAIADLICEVSMMQLNI